MIYPCLIDFFYNSVAHGSEQGIICAREVNNVRVKSNREIKRDYLDQILIRLAHYLSHMLTFLSHFVGFGYTYFLQKGNINDLNAITFL